MTKQVIHPDELTASDDVIPRPVSVTAHVERAKKLATMSGIKFRSPTELADYLNSKSVGKFVAVVFDNQCIVGPGDVHPDTVLQQYVEASDELKPTFIVPIPSPAQEASKSQATSPETSAPPVDILGESGLPLKEERPETPPQTRMPGAPPRFQGGSAKTFGPTDQAGS